ncbi:hypothetical protein ACTFIZ_008744 [Dictyostelium cf. discoideum]
MTVWDVGCQYKIHTLWKHLSWFKCNHLFKEESDNLLIQDELKGTQILIFENKQDMNNIMNTTDIVNSLNLNSIKDRKSYIQPCSAIKSNAIYEGFNWITNSLNINK